MTNDTNNTKDTATPEDEDESAATVSAEKPTVLKTVKTVKTKSDAAKAKKVPAKKKRNMKRGESTTSPRRIAAIEQTQLQALEYRKMAYSFSQIAEALGLKSAQAAHYAVNAALTRIIREPAEQVLQLELERLDGMFSKPYQAACNGDLMAVNSCLGIMARKAKLLGLDAPSKVDNTVSNKDGKPLVTEVHNMTPDDMDAAAKRLLEKY